MGGLGQGVWAKWPGLGGLGRGLGHEAWAKRPGPGGLGWEAWAGGHRPGSWAGRPGPGGIGLGGLG